jgi:hypothetical protein
MSLSLLQVGLKYKRREAAATHREFTDKLGANLYFVYA